MIYGVVLALLLVAPLPAQRAGADDVSAIVARYTAWRGGSAFEKLTSIHEKGRVSTAGLHGTFERYAGRDGRERQSFTLGGFEGSSAVLPQGSWSENKGVVQDMPAAAAEDSRRLTLLEFGPAFHGAHGAKLVRRPDEVRDGRSWAVIGVDYGGPDRYDVFVDRESGELHGWRVTQNRVTRFIRLSDWRMVSGVRVPFRSEQLFDNPAQNTVQIDEVVELGVALPDSLFARPRSVRLARFGGGRTGTEPLPFRFVDSSRIYIPARVDGHPIDLLLDSGAGTTVLDRAFADSIGVKMEGKGVANGTGGQVGVAFAHDVPIEIGNMTLQVPTVTVIDLSSVEKRLGVALPVILGADVFEQLIVDIDFGRSTIAFHDPASFEAPAGATSVALENGPHGRTVPVRIENGPEVQVDFDLGNGGSFLIFPSYWQSHHMLDGRMSSTRLGGAVGGAREEKLITVKDLTFAGHTFHDVPTNLSLPGATAVDSDRSFGNLGIQVYSRFHLMTDYPHDRLYLVPNGAGLDAPFRHDRSGLNTLKSGNALKVVFVGPGSPAEKAGWKAGESIVAVNGHPIGDDYEGSPLSHWNEGESGKSVKLTLSDGSTRELTLRDYY